MENLAVRLADKVELLLAPDESQNWQVTLVRIVNSSQIQCRVYVRRAVTQGFPGNLTADVGCEDVFDHHKVKCEVK